MFFYLFGATERQAWRAWLSVCNGVSEPASGGGSDDTSLESVSRPLDDDSVLLPLDDVSWHEFGDFVSFGPHHHSASTDGKPCGKRENERRAQAKQCA